MKRYDHTSLRRFIPQSWQTAKPLRLMVSGYQSLGVSSASGAEIVIDFSDSVCVLVSGMVSYYVSSDTLRIEEKGNAVHLLSSPLAKTESPEGNWILFMHPYSSPPGQDISELWKPKEEYLCGLLRTILGDNIVHHKIFENDVNFTTNEIAASTEAVAIETPLRKRIMTEDLRKQYERLYEKLASLPNPERTKLALRWHNKACTTQGIDGFLSHWISYEVLAMPDSANIGPLKKTIADAYESTVDQISEEFHIGRMYDLRSRT